MRSGADIVYVLGTVALALLIVGCDDDHDSMMSRSSNTNSLIAKVYPTDGATGIVASAAIAVTFTKPMDTISVMTNFHLVGGSEMQVWMDSVNHYGGLGRMSMDHMNHMMQRMDSLAMQGTFHWNDYMDSCEFVPDSMMMANQEYMILMYEGAMIHHGSDMMGMNYGTNEYHMFHFVTEL